MPSNPFGQPNDEIVSDTSSMLVDELSKETSERVRRKAVSEVVKIETHSVAPNTPERIDRVLINTKTNLAKRSGRNVTDRSETLKNIPDEKIIELSKAFLMGGWLEALSNELQLDEATTVYVGTAVERSDFNNCKLLTPEQLFFSSRKDHILAVLYLETVERSGNNDDPDIEKLLDSPDDRKKIVTQMKNYFGSYVELQKEWGTQGERTNNYQEDEKKMFEWYVSKVAQPVYGWDEKASNYARKTMEEILEINKHSHQDRDAYFYMTVPDSFVVGEDGKIICPCEVKAYSETEMRAWTKGLVGVLNNEKAMPSLKVSAKVGDSEMSLGPDISAEQRFVDLVNAVRSSETTIGGSLKRYMDKIAAASPEHSPIIIRTPEDISIETVRELASTAEVLGFDKLVFQYMPFTRKEDLPAIARYFCEEAYKSSQSDKNSKVSSRDRRIKKALAKPETWEM
jgi:hypothetical protein